MKHYHNAAPTHTVIYTLLLVSVVQQATIHTQQLQ